MSPKSRLWTSKRERIESMWSYEGNWMYHPRRSHRMSRKQCCIMSINSLLVQLLLLLLSRWFDALLINYCFERCTLKCLYHFVRTITVSRARWQDRYGTQSNQFMHSKWNATGNGGKTLLQHHKIGTHCERTMAWRAFWVHSALPSKFNLTVSNFVRVNGF